MLTSGGPFAERKLKLLGNLIRDMAIEWLAGVQQVADRPSHPPVATCTLLPEPALHSRMN